jgi:hypothetical protein
MASNRIGSSAALVDSGKSATKDGVVHFAIVVTYYNESIYHESNSFIKETLAPQQKYRRNQRFVFRCKRITIQDAPYKLNSVVRKTWFNNPNAERTNYS